MKSKIRSLHEHPFTLPVVSGINILAITLCESLEKLWLIGIQLLAVALYWYAEYRRRRAAMELYGCLAYALCKAGNAEFPNEVCQIHSIGKNALNRLLYIGPAVLSITLSIVFCNHDGAEFALTALNWYAAFYLFRIFMTLSYCQTDMKDIAQNLYRLYGHMTNQDYGKELFDDRPLHF